MTTTPSSPLTTPTPQPLPTAPPQSQYNSAYVQIETFVFNPTLVIGFLHRVATNEESVGVTDVLYGGHHVTVEDRSQRLFNYLCHKTTPTKPVTTITPTTPTK